MSTEIKSIAAQKQSPSPTIIDRPGRLIDDSWGGELGLQEYALAHQALRVVVHIAMTTDQVIRQLDQIRDDGWIGRTS